MPFSTTTEIAAPAARVWSILIDTHLWPVWGPSLRRVRSAGRFIDATTTGRLQTTPGIWLSFEIDRFEDGRYWSWRVAGVPATGHRVESLGRHRCRLSFEVPMLAAPYLAVCRVACRRIRAMAERMQAVG
ncbi:MAG: SRPBCC family protein [Gammaproteobacteria bacterium]